MAGEHEPMGQVRKSFRISWYRSPIEPARLKEFTRRSDLRGSRQTFGHLALLVITAVATWYFFNQKLWAGFALGLFAHGTIYSFVGGLAPRDFE